MSGRAALAAEPAAGFAGGAGFFAALLSGGGACVAGSSASRLGMGLAASMIFFRSGGLSRSITGSAVRSA